MDNMILIPLIIFGLLELVVCICIARCADMLNKIEAELQQLRSELNRKQSSLGSAPSDSWVCSCGSRNAKDKLYCMKCGRKSEQE